MVKHLSDLKNKLYAGNSVISCYGINNNTIYLLLCTWILTSVVKKVNCSNECYKFPVWGFISPDKDDVKDGNMYTCQCLSVTLHVLSNFCLCCYSLNSKLT